MRQDAVEQMQLTRSACELPGRPLQLISASDGPGRGPMRGTDPLVVIVVRASALGCACGGRRLKAADRRTQPREAAGPAPRLLRVLVTVESHAPIAGLTMTATWGDTTRSVVT